MPQHFTTNRKNGSLSWTLSLILFWAAVWVVPAAGQNNDTLPESTGTERLAPARSMLDLLGDPVAAAKTAAASARPAAGAHDPSHILVRFRPGVSRAARAAVHDPAKGRRRIKAFSVVGGLELVEVAAGDVTGALAEYRANPDVMYCEPDYRVFAINTPNDPSFGLLWGMRNTGQTVRNVAGTAGADIGATAAWDVWTGDPAFVVAVIDTGTDYTHEDLAANIWVNPDEIAGNGVDDDGNGLIDDVHGYDFINDDGDPMDDNGHGTHVAGTIGAVGNNGVGVAGVNWRCQIMALKFLGSSGFGSISGAIAAIEYASAKGVLVSNNSWGSSAFSQALFDAIDATRPLGHLFVAAAGNDTTDADTFPSYPAAYDLANVLSVAAVNNNDQLATFSNYGLTSVDLGAPGVNIFSTFPADQYTFLNGTSMASPHVTGVAALFRSRLPGISATAAKAHLMLTARPVPALAGITVTGGVVNALAAIDDCNGNGLSDAQEIADGLVADCSGNGIPDSCEPDCNSNGIADSCDFLSGLLTDCSGNELPDQCEPDCDGDGVADSCVLFGGLDVDCDGNHIPDGCEPDCDGNGITDACDLRDGTHADCTGNGIPDVCEPDCDGDGVADSCAIAAGTATDCDDNGIPDSCDLAGGAPDCNGNGFPDACDPDCDFNGVPDDCDLAAGAPDCTGNGVLDACEFDCNENGQADSCEIAAGTLPDSNGDGVADVCVFGFQLVPVGASGPHTINGAEITLDSADQKVFLEVRMLGWNPLLADVPKLRAYQAAMEPASFTSGIGTPLDFSRIPCNIDADCPNGFFAPGLCQDGLCDAQSSHHVDETHPTFVFRGREATSGTFRNAGFPPFAGSVVVDPARSVRFSRTPQYGVTVALEVPAGASGRYVVRFFEDQTFWLAENATNIPVPQFEPAIIVLPQDCNGNGIEDRIEIATGTAADCNGNAIPDECLSFEADCNANGLVDECEIADGSTPDVNGNGIPDACETARIFVDVSAMGAANGQSWADAFPDLQDALDFTVAAGGTVRELWVAAGVYVPSRPTMAADNRTRTFTLLDGVALYGGFAGGETSLDQRDVETNAAVLSGDQLGNDGPNFTGNADNSYHVVLAKNVDRGAVLDGFAVIAGHADGAAIRDFNIGGGLFVLDATPTVSRCTFRQNRANIGAGMAVKNLTTPSPDRNVQVDQCRFLDNLGNVGGAVFTHFDTEFTARYCRFIGNRGLIDAGAVKTGDFRTRSTFLNCLFSGNRVTGTHGQGGAMLVTNGSTNTLINCTVVNNSSPDPPGGLAMGGADVTLFNSVIWGNRGNASSTEVDQVFVSTSGAVAVSLGHNDIEGWTGILGGIGNIGDDPQFFDPDGPDNIVGTIDDDLHVTASSPAVNAGDNSVVPTDLLIDLDGQPRVFSLAVDMGVYEIGVPPDCAGVNQCSGHGLCIRDDTCVCDSGWTGAACLSFACADVGDCRDHGTCVGPNTCACDAGFDPPFCTPPIPTVSSWGLLVTALSLITLATLLLRARRYSSVVLLADRSSPGQRRK